MSYVNTASLGALGAEEILYDTRKGIFRPGGYGGGVFDGNIAGLGAVPAACWSTPGFNDCHSTQFAAAQTFCFKQTPDWLKARGYPDVDTCVKETDSAYTDLNCVSKLCAGTSSGSATLYPWGVYSAATLDLQKQTNATLKAAGYCPISTDGKLGKGTCGAVKKLTGSAPASCQGFTDPSKGPCGGGSVSPSTLTPAQQAAMLQQYGGGTDWKKYLLFAGGAALVLGAAYYIDKRRKK